jgi:hypothetical protein
VSIPLLSADQAQFVEAVARRVVELLDERDREQRPSAGLVDAQTLGRLLGISRSTVYEHASEFGAVQLGIGSRARLRFDVEKAWAAWTRRDLSERSEPAQAPAVAGVVRRRRRTAARSTAGLLPVRGQESG